MLIYGEVIDVDKAFKSNQKNDIDDTDLFDGSILVRLHSSKLFSNVKNVYAAPSSFNKRIPLVGEHVLIYPGTSSQFSSSGYSDAEYFYLTITNSNDSVTLGQDPHTNIITTNKSVQSNEAEILADKAEIGYTTKKNIKSYGKLQPYEGDDIWEGRFGQSIRFSRSFQTVNSPGMGIYEINHSSYWKGKSEDDSLIIFNLTKNKGSSYKIEDLSSDDASIYMTTAHKLLKFRPGFGRNVDVKKISSWDNGSQVLINADRFVLNAKKDKGLIIAKDELILTSDLVRIQTGKYNVSFDDLMDWLEEAYGELQKLSTGNAVFTTSMGPTAVSSNTAQITKLHKAEWAKRFKQP